MPLRGMPREAARVQANGRIALACQAKDEHFDPLPVVKLFTPDAGATGYGRAAYSPRADRILMPDVDRFTSPEAYCATALACVRECARRPLAVPQG